MPEMVAVVVGTGAPARDAAAWKEDLHPRKSDGEFAPKGQGEAPTFEGAALPPDKRADAISGIPKPKEHRSKGEITASAAMVEVVAGGISKGVTPGKMAEALKLLASASRRNVVASHANRLLRYIEQTHGLGSGSLGKARVKADGSPPKPKPEPPPQPPKPEPLPQTKAREKGPVPAPPVFEKSDVKRLQLMRNMVEKSVNSDLNPDKIAAAIRAMVAADPVESLETYGNILLRHIETRQGLEFGSLGNAIPNTSGGAVTLADVLKKRGMTPREKEWHSKSWANAPPDILAAMVNTPTLDVVHKENVGSFYRRNSTGGAPMVNIDMSYADETVWRHEFGHAIDYGYDGEQRSAVYYMERAADAEEVISRFGRAVKSSALLAHALKIAKVGESERVAVYSASTSTDFRMFADFLGATTFNQVGFGHEDGYYIRNPAHLCGEMFANYVALSSGPSGELYRKLMHTLASRTCQKFDELISDIGSGKV